jgi:NADH dehydrogenase [ubiquinone] 1 alpha subcomplex assembly factor 5
MNVFDRNIKKSQKNLTSIDPEYKNYEYLFEEVGYRVADRVFDVKRSFNRILDLGSSRGYVSKHLTKETVNKIIMLEMADKVLVRT